MKRRTILVGIGSAAAGSAVVFGSGAFTQVSADRGVTIGIDRDSEALLALVPNDDFDSIEEVEGELTIDSEKLSDDNEGFNVGATIEIGETDDDEVVDGEEAFKIVNNFDSNVNVTIDLTDEDFEDGTGELTFHTTRSDNELSESVTADETDGELALETVESGAEVLVAIEIETDGTDDPEDLDGEVTFSADPSAQEAPPGEPGSVQLNGEPKDSLDDAVGDAEDGDTITLGPSNSSYELTHALDVPNLTIEGPNVGVPGDGDRGSEAVVEGSVEVDASGVALSGLEIDADPDNATIDSSSDAADNLTVEDSVVRADGGKRAIQQGNNTEELTVANSLFEREDPGEETALNLNNGAGDAITGTVFDGFSNAVRMEDPDTADGITVEDNHISGHATGIVVRGQNHEIRNNVFEDGEFGNEVGITVSSGRSVKNVDIEDNEFRNNQFGLFTGDDSEDVTIQNNEFEDNDVHFLDEDNVVDVTDVLENNDFDAAASVDDLDQDGNLAGNTGAILPEVQEAVDEAADDATVKVAPGTYEVSIEVDVEGITIEGPNADIHGDSDDRGPEATIETADGETAFFIDASNVTLNGLEIDDADSNRIIEMDPATENTVITSSIIRGEGFGAVFIEGSNVEFSDNLAEQLDSGSAVQGEPEGDLTIENNVFLDSSAFDDANGPMGDIVFSGNEYTGESEAGIRFGGGMSDEGWDSTTITENTFDSGGDFVIKFYGDVLDNTVVEENNWVADGGNKGIEMYDSGELDARDNWWGADNGPSGGVEDPETEEIADGDGAEIDDGDGSVRFDPFTEEPFDLD